MSCPYCDTCPMFVLFQQDAGREHLRWAFCHGEHGDCERYKKVLAGEHVSENFMPTGEYVALKQT